jgi:hypothetical protein
MSGQFLRVRPTGDIGRVANSTLPVTGPSTRAWKRPVAVEQNQSNALGGAGLHQGRRYVDRPEDDDRRQQMQRDARFLVTFDLRDGILAILAQARSLGRDIECIEKFSSWWRLRQHPVPPCGRARLWPAAERPSGRQSSISEQARQRVLWDRRRAASGGSKISPPDRRRWSRSDCAAQRRWQSRHVAWFRHRRGAPSGTEGAGHLPLQAKRLRAKLHLVGAVRFHLAALILHGIGGPPYHRPLGGIRQDRLCRQCQVSSRRAGEP